MYPETGGNWIFSTSHEKVSNWKIGLAVGFTAAILVVVIVTLVKLCRACRVREEVGGGRQGSGNGPTETQVIYEEYDNSFVGLSQPLLQDSTFL
jgi:hypothetical protein